MATLNGWQRLWVFLRVLWTDRDITWSDIPSVWRAISDGSRTVPPPQPEPEPEPVQQHADVGETRGSWYSLGFGITVFIVFIGSWIYCIAAYGFLFGVGLG